jgi:two-component system, NarL family, nitrate/nitrite response regulator NarL
MKSGKITLALVDDHQIVIDGLMSLLKGHETFRFAFATTHPEEVIQKMGEIPVDILLTDIMMPQLTGNVLAKQVKEKFPHVKILALSMSGQGDLVNEMINDADISGYVLKNIGKQELINCRWWYLFQ